MNSGTPGSEEKRPGNEDSVVKLIEEAPNPTVSWLGKVIGFAIRRLGAAVVVAFLIGASAGVAGTWFYSANRSSLPSTKQNEDLVTIEGNVYIADQPTIPDTFCVGAVKPFNIKQRSNHYSLKLSRAQNYLLVFSQDASGPYFRVELWPDDPKSDTLTQHFTFPKTLASSNSKSRVAYAGKHWATLDIRRIP